MASRVPAASTSPAGKDNKQGPRPLSHNDADAALSSMINEALHSPLDLPQSPPRASSATPRTSSSSQSPTSPAPIHIAPPPRAYHPTSPTSAARPSLRPRLVSQLTRATLPTASLTYANAEENHWSVQGSPPSSPLGSPTARRYSHPWDGRASIEFPDLDPSTGLPLRRSMDHDDRPPPTRPQGSRPYTVQRTISHLRRRGSRSSLEIAQTQSRPFSALSGTWTAPAWFSTSKTKIDSMLDKDDQAPTAEEEHIKHQIKYRTPKYPVVLCHGLLGFDYLGPAAMPAMQISHWRGIREVLEGNGCEVFIARVPATSSIKDRATTLNDLISEKYPGRTVNLIAHSMGGLDCRYLISQIRPHKFEVASLTTISTPHRGSPFADYVIDNVIGRERLPQLLSMMGGMQLPATTGDGTAFQALGTRAMKVFNTEVIDRQDVKYYSWGASFDPGLLDTFRWPHSVILAKEGPNDGLVSVYSARWGEYRGTLLDVNHLDLVGWVNQVRYLMSGLTGKQISFKPATFYLEICDFLASQGF